MKTSVKTRALPSVRHRVWSARQTATALLIALAWTPCVNALTPQEVRQRVRYAMGLDRLSTAPGGMTVLFDTDYLVDLQGTTTTWLGQGSAFLTERDGPVAWKVGFDGKRGHAVEWSGAPYRLALEELELRQLAHWVYGGYWVRENAPIVVALDDERSGQQTVVCALSLTKGRLNAKLTIYRTTWLPKSLESMPPARTHRWEYGDFKSASGVTLAHKITYTDAEGNTEEHRLRSIKRLSEVDDERFQRLSRRPNDTRFDPRLPAAVETKQARTGHLLVHPLVNGSDIGWFMFDSATEGMLISTAAADKLSLPVLGQLAILGTGGTEFVRLRRGATFQLGPVTVDGFTYGEIDLSFLGPLLGTPIGGICGFDLFARCVVSVDFPKCEIALFNPKQYGLSQGHWGEFVFTGRTPAVRGTFEGGRTGLFMIDTGASRAVTFHTSFREELAPLIERATGRAVSTGIGGSQSAVTGTLAWLSLGEHRFENVDASYSLATEGDFTDSYTIGTIGSRLFDNRAVIFHYADQKLAIVPSRKE